MLSSPQLQTHVKTLSKRCPTRSARISCPKAASVGPNTLNIVTLSWEQLSQNPQDVSLQLLEAAYGRNGPGLLTVSGIPGLPRMRQRLLRLASQLAELPPSVLANYEDPASMYNFGWSCGKEAMQDGRPDTYKGSFYANPLLDNPSAGDTALEAAHPSCLRPNVWPCEELPELEPAFKELGQLVVSVGMLVLHQCDRYVSSINPSMPEGRLSRIIRESRNHKARLLHYFPQQQRQQQQGSEPHGQGADIDHDATWCGWHTDHGSLTGLTSALFMLRGDEVACPDPSAGLYAKTRKGDIVKVAIPPDHLAFQVGEALQVHSGGALQATPHYVRAAQGPGSAGVARNTFAVFMQPDVCERMDAPDGVPDEAVAVGQWRRDQTFGTFSDATFKKYYNGAMP